MARWLANSYRWSIRYCSGFDHHWMIRNSTISSGRHRAKLLTGRLRTKPLVEQQRTQPIVEQQKTQTLVKQRTRPLVEEQTTQPLVEQQRIPPLVEEQNSTISWKTENSTISWTIENSAISIGCHKTQPFAFGDSNINHGHFSLRKFADGLVSSRLRARNQNSLRIDNRNSSAIISFGLLHVSLILNNFPGIFK